MHYAFIAVPVQVYLGQLVQRPPLDLQVIRRQKLALSVRETNTIISGSIIQLHLHAPLTS